MNRYSTIKQSIIYDFLRFRYIQNCMSKQCPIQGTIRFRLRGFRKVEARSHSIRLYCSDILIGIEYWSFGGRRIDGVIYQFCQLQHSHIRPDLTVVMADGPIDIDYVSFWAVSSRRGVSILPM